ncbi:MAG TPA: TIGR03089 family protein [Jatrophihabitantaceae bacterium]|jgi:uncharacterized protein (TIGR03089 family)
MTPEQLFSDLLAAEPGRPFVTYYDEASGERSELSLKSLANWVAKTHFLLTDELGLGVGDTALVALPAHWISVPALLGSLTAGLSLSATAADAAVAFVSPSSLADADGVPDVYAVAPLSAAVGFGGNPPAGADDYVAAVRPQPDTWPAVHPAAGPSDPCLDGRSRADVVVRARDRARVLHIEPGARVLTTRDWSGPDDWLDTLFAPLAVGGSVVYVRNAPDDATIDRRMAQERATVRV